MTLKIFQILLTTFLFLLGKFLPISDTGKVIFYLVSYCIIGGEILYNAVCNVLKKQWFDENFLMALATIGALFLGEYAEAIAVLLLYQIGETCNDLAVDHSRKSIVALMNLKSEFVFVKRENNWEKEKPENVKIKDILLIEPGSKIALDGHIIKGSSYVDTSSLTGESKPVKVSIGSSVLSGMINGKTVLEMEVEKEYKDSTATRILKLVEDTASTKAPTEKFITKFSKYYTPIILVFALFLTIVPTLCGGEFTTWFHRSLIFLVISCPCALVISIPLSFFSGIGACSKNGILVKGSNYLEALKQIDTVFFDKTGTLTKGVFALQKVKASDEDKLLEILCLAESYSTHPIAASIKSFYKGKVDSNRIKHYEEIAGYGIKAIIDGKEVLAGKRSLLQKENIEVIEEKEIGSIVYVAYDKKYLGCVIISDALKNTSKDTIESLKVLGIKTVLLTGDQKDTATYYKETLKMEEVFSELLPEEKVEKVTSAKGKNTIVFMGDGINDAPALLASDVGVSLGGFGSDAAIEASDIVLMQEEPIGLIKAISIARYTQKIVWQNIVFALTVKGIILLLGSLGLANMWMAVFADVGVSFLTILNSLRIMKHFHKKKPSIEKQKLGK